MLQESANEATQKGWCDKSLSDAHQKRDKASEGIEELNGQMAELEATKDKLSQQLEVLDGDIKGLKEARATAEKTRADEKTENTETIKEANEGLDALNKAIDLLSQFYKGAAKNKVE